VIRILQTLALPLGHVARMLNGCCATPAAMCACAERRAVQLRILYTLPGALRKPPAHHACPAELDIGWGKSAHATDIVSHQAAHAVWQPVASGVAWLAQAL
jgi:hypothetical protein